MNKFLENWELSLGEEITVHCGYNDFAGKLDQINEETIKLKDKKEIHIIKISEIYAITKNAR